MRRLARRHSRRHDPTDHGRFDNDHHTASDGVTDDDGRADHGGTRAATDPSDAATDPRPDVAGTDRDAHGAPRPRRAANGTSDEPGADDDRGGDPG